MSIYEEWGPQLDALANACPACAQQPREWCAEWVDQIGMMPSVGLIHPERYGLDTEGQAMSSDAFRSATIKALKGII